jgi:hypothetical protein
MRDILQVLHLGELLLAVCGSLYVARCMWLAVCGSLADSSLFTVPLPHFLLIEKQSIPNLWRCFDHIPFRLTNTLAPSHPRACTANA